MNKFKH